MEITIGVLTGVMLWMAGDKYKYTWYLGALTAVLWLFGMLIGKLAANPISVVIILAIYVRNIYKWKE